MPPLSFWRWPQVWQTRQPWRARFHTDRRILLSASTWDGVNRPSQEVPSLPPKISPSRQAQVAPAPIRRSSGTITIGSTEALAAPCLSVQNGSMATLEYLQTVESSAASSGVRLCGVPTPLYSQRKPEGGDNRRRYTIGPNQSGSTNGQDLLIASDAGNTHSISRRRICSLKSSMSFRRFQCHRQT